MSRQKSSSGAEMHPYRRLSFWMDPANHFWNTDYYSQKSKDYFDKCLQDKVKAEPKLINL